MNSRRHICLIGLLFGVLLLIPPRGWAQAAPETKGPIITNVYAMERRGDGSIWKIFIEAKGLDEKMDRIGIMMDQVGYGHYPTEWVYLKPQYEDYLKGYLQWNINNLRDKIQITVKLFIVDRAGKESNEVVFPLTIELGSEMDYSWPGALLDQSELPAPFDQGDVRKLGYINIDLVGPDNYKN